MLPTILILCPDFITERMAGPAIRYWEFAKALAMTQPVTLATPNEVPVSLHVATPARLIQHTSNNIVELCEQHDIILFQGHIFDQYPLLRRSSKVLIADLYDPIVLEGLEQQRSNMPIMPIPAQIRVVNEQLKHADYFLCASDRQRDLWLGHLLALGRINSATYMAMQQRLVVVPFGIPDQAPQRTDVGLKPAGTSPFILLWGGGIWEWFDPLTVIHAVHHLSSRYPHLQLVFLGTRHPNPTIPIMPRQQQAETLARDLGLYGKQVIFHDGWVRYDELPNYLLDADVGISAHFDTLETHFSFRTRLLYYLWAGKPIITTQGDVLAMAIAEQRAGIVVAEKDINAWIEAIERLQDAKTYDTFTQGAKSLAHRYGWTSVVHPLREICANPSFAPDRVGEVRQMETWDCEQAYNGLKQHVEWIERSNSWKLTAPLRGMRRMLTRFK